MTRIALVTGATGFIGHALASRLIGEGWQVAALVRESSDATAIEALGARVFRIDDTVDTLAGILNSVRPDIVFHLASLYLAGHRPDQVSSLVDANVQFPTRLLEAMAVTGVGKLVNTGTSWQHGGRSCNDPVNLYAATKQAFEDILRYYASAHALTAVTLKLFDTYGPGDTRRKLVRIIVDAVHEGETLDMSPGEQIVDLTHVDDVVDAFLIAADVVRETAPGGYRDFFVSGERYRVKDLVALVARVADHAPKVNFGGRPYRPREVMQPVSGADRLLPGWKASRNLADEIRRLLET